ncbi:VirD4-like conjugal transfer protein, CD1115 family [Halobacillus sp. KGW1]|uniref:VirD4-like conjugal transfer protein, CD1115 family n=1 Tax=Halobacillus sp. KGW1 TaxID=1793726 RepID=UPI0007830F76|nr:type IV secretory system conjugative DNA transfer family protein [Halobacillus sp. KGW1]
MRKKSVHIVMASLGAVFVFFLLNTVINLITITVQDVWNSDSFLQLSDLDVSIQSLVLAFDHIPSQVYIGMAVLTLVVFGILYYKLRTNFKDLEKSGDKGTSRFTTLKELKAQYKAVPEKKASFPGTGGAPISRYKNNIFIDDSPVNNLWIGTTRSGKGEMGIFPMIDIYSRAEEQASMVLNDPKGELFAASKETLEKRGYHVEVLNLDNPLQSMSYQLLQLVIDAYEDGDMAKAEQYTKTISTMLYSDPSAKDKFWQDSAAALCSALILGLCEKNIPHQKEKVTMYTVANTLNTLASEQYMDEITGDTETGLDRFFDSLPEQHPARLQYATIRFASGASQTVSGIFSYTFDKLSIFTLTPIAKMTSMNSFDMKKIGFGKTMTGFTKPLSRVYVHFPEGQVSVRTNEKGRFAIDHDEKLTAGDHVRIEVEDSDISMTVAVDAIDENGDVRYSVQEKSGEAVRIKRFEQFEKPTALFMITPDYDTSLHVIASLYVKQLYTELARTASHTKGGKCIREVVFILDEFGNMPVIDDMGSMITVCLGRNIKFNLVIQAYAQLKQKYEQDWETIDGNCANTIYILTTNNDTAEEVSKKLGEKTITSHSRSGSTLSFDKSKTEGTDGRSLLNATELFQLKEGETVVIRGIKRQDKKRKTIKAYPIFNTGETRMKYRYEYLADDFDTSASIHELDIRCQHETLDLKQVTYRFGEEKEHAGAGSIGELLGEDNILVFIEQTVDRATDHHVEELRDMPADDFLELLESLQEEGRIAGHTYQLIVDKIEDARQREGAGDNERRLV